MRQKLPSRPWTASIQKLDVKYYPQLTLQLFFHCKLLKVRWISRLRVQALAIKCEKFSTHVTGGPSL